MSDFESRRKRLIPQIKTAFRLLLAFTFSHVGVCGLVVAYIIFGAFLFQWIESNHESTRVSEVRVWRNETAEKLLQIMLKSQISKDEYFIRTDAEIYNYTYKIVTAILDGFDGEVPDIKLLNSSLHSNKSTDESIQWGFSGAFLYSLTVITTIGYGNVAPRTPTGKITTIVYGIIGMPLFLLYLSNIGDILARGFKWTFSRCCQCRWHCSSRVESGSSLSSMSTSGSEGGGGEEGGERGGGEEEEENITVPISVCLALMVAYIWGGGLWFASTEQWTVLDASYFCFISLSTIGFGDLVPGTSVKATDLRDAIQVSFIFCSLYLLLGMALIAMCFNLMQEEVLAKFRFCARRLGCS